MQSTDEREVLARDFSGQTRQSVTQTNLDSFEMRVQEEVDRFQAQFLEQQLPQLRAESERLQRALGLVSGSFFELATDRKRLRLHGRVALDFTAQP